MRRTTFAAVAVTGLLLAGCGGDDDSADEDTTTTEASEDGTTTAAEETPTESEPDPSEESTTTQGDETTTGSEPDSSETTEGDDTTTESEPDPSETTEAGGSTGGDGEITPGGTTLAYGDPAVVEYVTSDDETAQFEVTVTGVEESSLDDLAAAGLEVGDDLAGQVPYLVDYSVTNLTDVDVAGASVNVELSGVLGDGSRAGTLITIGFDRCTSASFSSDAAAGDTEEGCKVALVGEGAELAGIEYAGELDEPLVWQG